MGWQFFKADGSEKVYQDVTGLDHGTLTGLTDDDHTQYLKEKASGGVASEVPTHTHAGASNAGTVAHTDLTSVGANDHHNQVHGASDHTDITRYVFISPSMMTVDDATAINNEGSTPDLISRISFPEASNRSGALFSWMVPSDWASGAIVPTLIWAAGTSTGDVRWIVSMSEIAAGDNPAEASGTTASLTVADSTTAKYSSLAGITPTAAGNLIKFNVERNANNAADTATGNVFLYGVRLEYTANQ